MPSVLLRRPMYACFILSLYASVMPCSAQLPLLCFAARAARVLLLRKPLLPLQVRRSTVMHVLSPMCFRRGVFEVLLSLCSPPAAIPSVLLRRAVSAGLVLSLHASLMPCSALLALLLHAGGHGADAARGVYPPRHHQG